MAHIREQIRKAIVAALTGQTNAGTRVYATRVHPAPITALPYINVYIDDDAPELESMNGNLTRRDLTVRVDIFAKHNTELDDTLDDMGASVEQLIAADETLGGIARTCEFSGASFDYESAAEQTLGVLTMEFLAQTRVRAATPQTVDI